MLFLLEFSFSETEHTESVNVSQTIHSNNQNEFETSPNIYSIGKEWLQLNRLLSEIADYFFKTISKLFLNLEPVFISSNLNLYFMKAYFSEFMGIVTTLLNC